MPSIDRETLQKLTTAQRRYSDTLARQVAEQRLNDLDAHVLHERERRGMKPIMSDTGAILGWVRTRPQPQEGR